MPSGGVTTDRNGNASEVLGTGAGVYRVYDEDTATIWGTTSAAARA